MAKKNRQNPPKPKEFHASPFSELKGMALPEAAPEKKQTPVVQKAVETVDNGLDLFMQAVADVKPLLAKRSATAKTGSHSKTISKKVPVVSPAEEQAGKLFIQEINRLKLDTKFADSVPDDGEMQQLSNNRLRQVKRGIVSVDYQIDLHGLTKEEALLALPRFLASASRKGQKAVLIITGKGNHSAEEPVLNQAVASWLRDAGRSFVVEYAPAPREMGGSGAYVAFLRPPTSPK